MTDSNHEPDEPLSDFEQRLRAFRPRSPKVDLSPNGQALVDRQSTPSATSTMRSTTRWLGWLAASWLVGAMIGGSAVYVAMAQSSGKADAVEIANGPKPPRGNADNRQPDEAAAQPFDSSLAFDDWSNLPVEGPLDIRSWTRMGSRLVSSKVTSDSHDFHPSTGTTHSAEPTEPPTRDRLMRELLN